MHWKTFGRVGDMAKIVVIDRWHVDQLLIRRELLGPQQA